MKNLILTLFLTQIYWFSAQLNLDSISHVNYMNLHDTYLNDVWGHVDSQGTEYALVGARKGTSIVSLQDPSNPVEIFWEPGMESIWRDIKTWQNYAYVTTEAQNGLLIIDMNSLPNANELSTNYYTGPNDASWFSAHNLYIDSNGFAYIFGANRGNGGVIILDVHTDPMNPIEVGTFDNWYAHDGYVVNDTLFGAHISDGFLSVVDITNKAVPVLLGTKNTHSNFTHNIWTTTDGNIGFTTDEVSGAFLGAYDLTDPSNIVELDLVQSSPGLGVIPHNVHVKDGFLITSYYSDGVTIHDISRPHNMIQIGFYDTYPDQTTSYDGCWGAYPFLPSGIILGSDISEGLFILQPNYKHASFLEGTVYDQETSLGLMDVKIEILNSAHLDYSKNEGIYATGSNLSGTFEVTYSKVGYYPQTFTLNLQENQVLIQDVYLVPIVQFPYKIIVKEEGTNNEILDAQVEMLGSLTTDFTLTNGLGEATIMLYYEENYAITVGKWGYITHCVNAEINENSPELTIFLKKGYYDDFTFDFSWSSINNGATSGLWERGIPNPTSSQSAPGYDASFDCGNKAFVTGNNPSLSTDIDNVKNGEVVLRSPTFDLTTVSSPYIHYSTWFYNFHGPNPPNDTLKIYLSNGFSTVLVDFQAYDESVFYHWTDKVIKVQDFIVPTANMTLTAKISDFQETVNVVEAGLDNFYIDSVSHLSIKENVLNAKITCFPNPTFDVVKFNNVEENSIFQLMDNQFRLVLNGKLSEDNKIDVSHLTAGIYFVQIQGEVIRLVKN